MSELNDLYQEVILDHNKNPRNWGHIDNPSKFSEGYNPLCGDRIDLYLKIDDSKVEDIRFEGNGCAISKASASIMTALVKGKTFEEIKKLFDEFHDVITHGCEEHEPSNANLEVFCGVKEFPTRVKCATLAWHTLVDALNKD